MKKLTSILLALCLTLALAACGGGNTPAATQAPSAPDSGETAPSAAAAPAGASDAVAGETYDAGNFKALVPSGWKAFPQHDVFDDDPNAMNPNLLQISKGASTDLDLFSKPCVTITYNGPGGKLMPPSKDFYDNVEDMADITTGDHTWSAFRCDSFGQKMAILFEDLGEIQYQAAVAYETSDGKIDINDADVQAVLASIAPSSAADAALAAAGGESGDGPNAAETAAANYDWWNGYWYGWWCIYNSTGIYEPANKIAWDAYAKIDVYPDNTANIRLWDTGTDEDTPLLFAYSDLKAGTAEQGVMAINRVDFFPYDKWNNGTQAAEMDEHVDITVDPADSTVSRFADMIEINGRYADPNNSADAFEYYIFLKPWGADWEDVRNGDTTGCLFNDMMPLYYDNWYKSLLALSYTHPVSSFEEGIRIINEATENGAGSESGGGALDPAGKEGADGKVDMATLQELLPWAKKLSYDTTYDEIAAKFGVHGKSVESLFDGKSIYRWLATDKDYIQITFDLHEDGSETWNVTQWNGIQ